MAYKVEMVSGEVFYTMAAVCERSNKRWKFDINGDNRYIRYGNLEAGDSDTADVVNYVERKTEWELMLNLNYYLSDLEKLKKTDYDKLVKRYYNFLLCLQDLEFDLQHYIDHLDIDSWQWNYIHTLLAKVKETINEQRKS